jgi:hypothetical protein
MAGLGYGITDLSILTGVGDSWWCGIGVARGVFGLWAF